MNGKFKAYKNQVVEQRKSRKTENIIMDIITKLLFPVCFISLKVIGSYIEFMINMSNVVEPNSNQLEESEDEMKIPTLNSSLIKNSISDVISNSFQFRTCVEPFIRFGPDINNILIISNIYLCLQKKRF